MLPFSFLEIYGSASEEIQNHLILVACQMMQSRIPQGMAEIKFGDKLQVIHVKTDFTTYSIGSFLSGILFKGQGGTREGTGDILFPFKVNFLLDTSKIGGDLLVAMDHPDKFLNYLKDNCRWLDNAVLIGKSK